MIGCFGHSVCRFCEIKFVGINVANRDLVHDVETVTGVCC